MTLPLVLLLAGCASLTLPGPASSHWGGSERVTVRSLEAQDLLGGIYKSWSSERACAPVTARPRDLEGTDLEGTPDLEMCVSLVTVASWQHGGAEHAMAVTSTAPSSWDCHACRPLLTTWLLSRRGEGWAVDGGWPGQPLGGQFGVPPDLSFMEVGPFPVLLRVDDAITSAGESRSWISLYSEMDARFGRIFGREGPGGSAGSCGILLDTPEPMPCFDADVGMEAAVDSSGPWPELRVRVSGIVPVASETWKFDLIESRLEHWNFDPGIREYVETFVEETLATLDARRALSVVLGPLPEGADHADDVVGAGIRASIAGFGSSVDSGDSHGVAILLVRYTHLDGTSPSSVQGVIFEREGRSWWMRGPTPVQGWKPSCDGPLSFKVTTEAQGVDSFTPGACAEVSFQWSATDGVYVPVQ